MARAAGPTRATTTCATSRSARASCSGIPFELIDPADERRQGGAHARVEEVSRRARPRPRPRFGGKARSLYFLHAAAWSGGHMATYVVHYADGTTAGDPHPRQGGDHELVGTRRTGRSTARPSTCPTPQTDDVGLVVFGWDNPQPDKAIRAIEFKSENGRRDRGRGGDHRLGQAGPPARPEGHPAARVPARATWTRSTRASGSRSRSSRTSSSRRRSTSRPRSTPRRASTAS